VVEEVRVDEKFGIVDLSLYSPVSTLQLPLFVVLMLLLLERESGRMFRVELCVPSAMTDDGPVFRHEERPTDVRLVVPHEHVAFKLEQTTTTTKLDISKSF
jgi:hypothetical protein